MNIKKVLREGLLMEVATMKVDMPIPDNVMVLSRIFDENGYELYVVGGAVRDFLLDKPIKDYDVVTNALPDQIEDILSKAGVRTIPTGKQFGIINAFVEGEEFEIATFRIDSKTGDGRRPDSVSFTDMKTDANRRDLTINALYYNIQTQEVIDYVGGVEDIKNGIVRTVGDPAERFEEDKLRILRAIRFAARTGNGLDPKIEAFLSSGYDLSEIASERIRDEFLKSIKSAISVEYLMQTYLKYDLFKWTFPRLEINTNFIDDNDHILVLAHLLIKNDLDSLGKKLNALNYTINEIRDIRFLAGIPKFLVPKLAYSLKKNQANTTVSELDILKIGELHGVNKNLLDAFNKFTLTVSGNEVMHKYNVTGPEVGQMITDLETLNFMNLLNNK